MRTLQEIADHIADAGKMVAQPKPIKLVPGDFWRTNDASCQCRLLVDLGFDGQWLVHDLGIVEPEPRRPVMRFVFNGGQVRRNGTWYQVATGEEVK